ncbi:MAG: hypothetical protein LUD50_06495 [Clostridia bacterium]|nr:hypothetical protein [Clostridia bacterium]
MEEDGKCDWEIEVDADLLEKVRAVLAEYGITAEEHIVWVIKEIVRCQGMPAFMLPALLEMVLEQDNVTDDKTLAAVHEASRLLDDGERIPYDAFIYGLCDRYRVPKEGVFKCE